MARGELSYSKVRALTRVATPETESTSLELALYGTASHIEKLVRAFRCAQEVEELSREARQQASRSLGYFFDDKGSLVLRARLPADARARVVKALEGAMEEFRSEPRRAPVTPRSSRSSKTPRATHSR
jgi:hypothetical protein